MTDPDLRIARALVSVSDKTGLEHNARRLAQMGVELVSTGGTARDIEEAGLAVRDVSSLTGMAEMMDGRVKTLHPAIHGALLFRRDLDTHRGDAAREGIEPIDLVYINLYPFEQVVAADADFDTAIENIDIGGPAMLRAAAKNAEFVCVCSDLDDLEAALGEMAENAGCVTRDLRCRLAAKTYARTAAYDSAISAWYARVLGETAPDWAALGGQRAEALRYGENLHQPDGFYRTGEMRPGVATAQRVQGKPLSYNNINDTDAAYELIGEFGGERPAVAIIKHANPCGVALADDLVSAYRAAQACDPVSAFGGIVAVNQPLTGALAEAVTEIFTEVVIAPGADAAARDVFSRKPNLRLLLTDALSDPGAPGRTIRSVSGGFLMQARDHGRIEADDLRVVTARAPSAKERTDLLFAWRVAKHVKSNTIVYARDEATAGIGAGQMSRLDAARIAARKAEDAAAAAGWAEPRTRGCVAASDAFFPFADGLLQAAQAGATAVIQPGGSVRDDEVIAAADEAGLAMVFTGMRHFRH